MTCEAPTRLQVWVSILTPTCFLSRLLRKQLNRYKHKLQGTYTLQKEQNCRFETKIQELATNQDNLWTKIQQMRQDLQVQMWEPLATWSAWKSNLKYAVPRVEGGGDGGFTKLHTHHLVSSPPPSPLSPNLLPLLPSIMIRESHTAFGLRISSYRCLNVFELSLRSLCLCRLYLLLFLSHLEKKWRSVSKTQSLTNWDMKLINNCMYNVFQATAGCF